MSNEFISNFIPGPIVDDKLAFSIYLPFTTEGLDFNTALDKCIQIKKHWAEILEKQIIKISNH